CACSILCLLQVTPRFRGHARDGATLSPLCHTSLSSYTPARGGPSLRASPPRTVATRGGARLQPGLHTPAPTLCSSCRREAKLEGASWERRVITECPVDGVASLAVPAIARGP